jgi:hypothetical protein
MIITCHFCNAPRHEHLYVCIIQEPEEQPEEQEVPEADEEVGEDLPECPDHRPSSFERDKPQSIFLLRFANILLILYFN